MESNFKCLVFIWPSGQGCHVNMGFYIICTIKNRKKRKMQTRISLKRSIGDKEEVKILKEIYQKSKQDRRKTDNRNARILSH